jgi:hypothetical protein
MIKKRKAKKVMPKRKLKTKRSSKAKAKPLRKSKRRAKVHTGQISASEKAASVLYDRKGLGAASGGQSGDLQGISDIAGAGLESVEELLEEGSSFEAEVLQGVERAADAEEQKVHTHEINEDDVPKEYLDQEREDRQ